ncbi:MAG: hypothetical protein HN356_02240 [Calditrichaeota bacterium]|jgi:hypothetical protein|nr:hypothetical protein [Calditrichota bacterium]MBT7618285.1 hypothetical protein [Calditrichota bacterium]MBT7787322.1 hypothetical protein [Calditrichota bacterium]
MSGLLDKLKEERKFSVWKLVSVFIVLILISAFFGLNSFFSTGNVGGSDDASIFFLDSATKIIVTLNNQIYHIPGCLEIDAYKGNTEKINYGKALGRGYMPCPLCIGDE